VVPSRGSSSDKWMSSGWASRSKGADNETSYGYSNDIGEQATRYCCYHINSSAREGSESSKEMLRLRQQLARVYCIREKPKLIISVRLVGTGED
jgi:hypothetical protein